MVFSNSSRTRTSLHFSSHFLRHLLLLIIVASLISIVHSSRRDKPIHSASMFASRAITVAQTGHRYTSAAKFTSTRQIQHDLAERERLAEIEEETHPNRSFVCALISFLFCPILGIFPLYFASRSVRAHRQGFFAEATTFSKKALRWSLICFIFGLLIGSSLGFLLFVKRTLFV